MAEEEEQEREKREREFSSCFAHHHQRHSRGGGGKRRRKKEKIRGRLSFWLLLQLIELLWNYRTAAVAVLHIIFEPHLAFYFSRPSGPNRCVSSCHGQVLDAQVPLASNVLICLSLYLSLLAVCVSNFARRSSSQRHAHNPFHASPRACIAMSPPLPPT